MRLVFPSFAYKDKAIQFINEFYEYNSDINGSGGLDRYLEESTYEEWLKKVLADIDIANVPQSRVPALTYFYIREEDDKILGMINIRLVLNEFLKREGGHIGYCIRPTERQKHYATDMLHDALKIFDTLGIRIDKMLQGGKTLTLRQAQRLETIRNIYEQQKYMYDNHTHTVPDRIVSVSQPFVRPIVRGKAGKPVEFGMKLDISVVNGWSRLEYHSFDAYNEATRLQEMIETFRIREGHYPSRVFADKIYRNRDNLRYCKEHGIRLSGPALGRPKKNEIRDKEQDYKDDQ